MFSEAVLTTGEVEIGEETGSSDNFTPLATSTILVVGVFVSGCHGKLRLLLVKEVFLV